MCQMASPGAKVQVVTMTEGHEVGSNTLRKLEVNEVLTALGEARRDAQGGLIRVRCRAEEDGTEGVKMNEN